MVKAVSPSRRVTVLSLVMVMLSLVVVVVDIRQVRDPCRYQWGKDGRGTVQSAGAQRASGSRPTGAMLLLPSTLQAVESGAGCVCREQRRFGGGGAAQDKMTVNKGCSSLALAS